MHSLLVKSTPLSTYKVLQGLSDQFTGPAASYKQRSLGIFNILGSTLL